MSICIHDQKPYFLLADGFYNDIARFAFLLPLLYGPSGVFGLGSCFSRILVTAPVCLGLLSLRLLLALRQLPSWAETQYTGMRKQLEGASPEDVEGVVAAAEDAVLGLKQSWRKGIIWADPEKKTGTDWVVVFLHGWSASRLEVSPLCERLAKSIGANCYFGRFPGHGIEMMGNGQEEMSFKSFVRAGLEGLAIGQTLGQRVLLVGASTGAAVNAWLCTQAWAIGNVHGSVIISTNVCTKPVNLIRTLGWIPLLRELVLFPIRGGATTRLRAPRNALHAERAVLAYPTRFTPLVFDISKTFAFADPMVCSVPTLAFHNPNDPRSCYKAAEQFVAALPNARMVQVRPTDEEHQHIITGEANAPSTIPMILQEIAAWMKELS